MNVDPEHKKDYNIDFERIKEFISSYEDIKKLGKISSYNVQTTKKVTH